MLKKAAPEKHSPNLRSLLEDTTAKCKFCQKLSPKPYSFQVTMPVEIQFNHEIIIDFSWIEPRPHRPVLHIVYGGTHFSAAQFVKGESAVNVWNTLISCWVSVFVGFPNIVTNDYGSCFYSEFFQNSKREFGIIAKAIPCESQNSFGPRERYHAPLRRIYKKLKIENSQLDNDVALSIAVHGLNNTDNLEDLIPTSLVLGCILKIPLRNIKHLCRSQRERFAAMDSSRKEMEYIVTKQRLKLAKKPRTKSMSPLNIQSGSEVLIYREKTRQWRRAI